MKRIWSTLVLTTIVLGGTLSAAQAAGGPRWFPLVPDQKKPAPALNDPSVELAAMQSRTVMVQAPQSAGPGGPSIQMVNSRSLVIDFDLKDLGPSGVGTVELWYTRNGQTWAKSPNAPQTQSPFIVEASEDGLYGFTVVASNGMGIGKAAPLPGDVPQMWVDVDTTKPEIHLLSTQAGADENGRTMTMRWTASDRNMVARPITLLYAESAEGQWIPFATNLENTGSYTWHMAAGLPNRVLVRVQATDRLGNMSADQSTMPSPIDLIRPTATIRNVTRNGVIVPVKSE